MVIVPGTTFRYALFGNISQNNPSTIFATSSLQTFSYTIQPSPWTIGRADDWDRLGKVSMPRQLLVAPDSGYFFTQSYAVASGTVSLPALTSPATVGMTIYQNVFSLVNGAIQVQSFGIGSTNTIVTANTTLNWQVVVGVQTNLAFGNGQNQPLQLSVGVALVFPTSSVPQVQMIQFEYQS